MGLNKKFLLITSLGMIMLTMGGCVYSNNKGWNDMTSEEKQDVRQNFEEIESDLRQDFASDDIGDKFASFILDTVEQAIDSAD